MVQTIDNLFSDDYEESDLIRLELKTTFWDHILASIDEVHFKRNLFLISPPGRGKTRLVRLLAEKLQIPLVNVNLALVKDAKDLFGDYDKPGLLLEAIAKSVYTNPILFTDEASEAFNNPELIASLKILLEPSLGRFDSPYLKSTSLNIRQMLWMSVGNVAVRDKMTVHSVTSNEGNLRSGLGSEFQGPLASRLATIQLPPFTKKTIEKFANHLVAKILKQHIYLTHLDSNFHQQYPEEWQELQEIIEKSDTMRDLERVLPTWCMKVNEKVRLLNRNTGTSVDL